MIKAIAVACFGLSHRNCGASNARADILDGLRAPLPARAYRINADPLTVGETAADAFVVAKSASHRKWQAVEREAVLLSSRIAKYPLRRSNQGFP